MYCSWRPGQPPWWPWIYGKAACVPLCGHGKTTKTTAGPRIAECDLAASEARDGQREGIRKRGKWNSPKVAGGSGGFWCFFFSQDCWFLEHAGKCHRSFDANWRCVVRGQSVGDVWDLSLSTSWASWSDSSKVCVDSPLFWCRVVECRLLKILGWIWNIDKHPARFLETRLDMQKLLKRMVDEFCFFTLWKSKMPKSRLTSRILFW